MAGAETHAGLFRGFLERRRQKRAERAQQEEELYRHAEIITLSELKAKMEAIEVFPGTKAEYEELKGMPYDYVNVPGSEKFLAGTLEKRVTESKGHFHASRFSIFSKACELKADAIVNFARLQRNPFDMAERIMGPQYTGIPVRKHQEPQNPQGQISQ